MATRQGIALLVAWCLGVAAPATIAVAPDQTVFPTADQAAAALVVASRANDAAGLLKILGPAGAKLVRSGDPVADRRGRERFVAAYDKAHRIDFDGPDKAALVVGAEAWPLPIPMVHGQWGWRFDARAAEQEILNRRIGRNELSVIEVCRAYVTAQREYAAWQARNGGRPEYAQRFNSSPGMHDGLYWPATDGEPQSPLGPLIAEARAGGYGTDAVGPGPRPYHGYFFRILSAQGPHAPGGARAFVVDGHMTAGFALVAYPAVYADSGVMTFIVSHNGIVFEKNLGSRTESLARRIERFDPDAGWRTP